MFHRKTAPGVRNGRVRKQNNWRRTPDCYNTPQRVPAIDRERPGEGYRHLLRKQDVGRFVALLPDWDEVSRGLDVILLGRGRPGCDGWYNGGVLAVCAWPAGMVWELDPDWYAGHCLFLDRIGVPVEFTAEGEFVVRWTPSTARAYQLVHVFLHELGHHIDRMTTRTRRSCARGEGWAEGYAWAYEAVIWERYCDEFGVPG
jgi:hypothetical protein